MKENIFHVTYGQSIISSNNFLIKQIVSEKQLFNRTDSQSITDYKPKKSVILPLSGWITESKVLDQHDLTRWLTE